MLKFNYLLENKNLEGGYITIPKVILNSNYYMENLSVTSILLYGWLKDKLNLSIANNVRDSRGIPYIFVTVPTMMRILGLSQNTVKKTLKELEKCKLILFEFSKSGNRKRILFLGQIDPKVDSYAQKQGLKSDTKKYIKKVDEKVSKSGSYGSQNLIPNNKENNNKFNNREELSYQFIKPFDFSEL